MVTVGVSVAVHLHAGSTVMATPVNKSPFLDLGEYFHPFMLLSGAIHKHPKQAGTHCSTVVCMTQFSKLNFHALVTELLHKG